MSDFFGSLWHGISRVNPKFLILSISVIVIIILLTILHKYFKNDKKKLTLWRALCFLPILISAIHYFIFYFGTSFDDVAAVLYIPAVMAALWALFGNKRIVYVISTIIVNSVAVLSCIVYISFGGIYHENFTRMSYTESFKATVKEMEDHYVLTEWKETDFDAIEAEILPLVEEAEKNHDPAAYAAAIGKYRYILNDGHINMRILDADVRDKYIENYTGNNYGFSMITLDNGETIAVVTDANSPAYVAGIHDGTKIVKWDGVPIDIAKENVEYTAVKAIPVASNEEFMNAIFLAGSGGDTVNVTFINDNGTEDTVTLEKIGNYYEKYDEVTSKLFSEDKTNRSNYSCYMLNDTCGYVLVNKEHYNSYDIIAYLTGNHIPARKMFLQKLDNLKAQGMETLVIDMRNNGGGYDDVALGWASVFADEQYYGFSLAGKSSSEYESVSDHYILKSGEYADMKVVVLTNMNCVSAGDGAVLYLSRLPNVTVLGMTDPNGSNQETGGSCYLSDGIVVITYPVGLVLDEAGNPNIDVSADRISRNPVDEYIPLTYDAAMQIFSGEGDYELEYAIEYLEKE